MKTIAVTGHRPPRLNLGYAESDRKLLTEFAGRTLSDMPRPAALIGGAAQGWDLACMHAALVLGIPVIAAVPFEGQESKWPEPSRAFYKEILSACDVRVICTGGYANWKFHERDKWMVDNGDEVVALFDSVNVGGTAATVAYAHKQGVPVTNVWGGWESFRAKE